MTLLQMSFSGAVLILAVVILRATAIHKLPKRTFLTLWEIVLFRLLIPFSIPSVFSVYSLVNQPAASAGVFTGVQRLPAAATAAAPWLPADTAPLISVRAVIWCVGSILCAGFFIITYLHCRMEFQASFPVRSDFTEKWLKEHTLRRTVSIRQSDRISAPLTYGMLHPVILLPAKSDWENIPQLEYILLHEFVHIRRFDAVKKLFATAALCIHWFNPAVWIMYSLFSRDIELACDEAVIRHTGLDAKANYARVLIAMEEKKSGLAPLCSSFSKNSIEERITAIMKTKRTTLFSIILACLSIFTAAGMFATSAIASNKNPGENAVESTFTQNQADPELYAVYEPFGLTVEEKTGKLYYNGELVRCFNDAVPTKNLSTKAIGYYEESGVVDVRAIRGNFANSYELSGLEALSPTEFNTRDIPGHTKYSAGESANMFDVYEAFGLKYDETKKALFYEGKRVRLFWDSRTSDAKPADSEKLFSSNLSNWDAEGTIDLYTVRDYKQPDENGYGKLTGLRIAAQEEYESNTGSFSSKNNGIETAE